MQVYNQDQNELKSRSANYTSRNANVADLIKDRQQTEAAYNRGYDNNSYSSWNFGKGLNYNSRSGFGIRI